jgi:hypothetical protein
MVGLTDAVIILATIAARWRLEPVGSRIVPTVPGAVLAPRRLRMRIVAR